MSIYLEKLDRTNKDIMRYAEQAQRFSQQRMFKEALQHYVYTELLIERAVMICEVGIVEDVQNTEFLVWFHELFLSMRKATSGHIHKCTLALPADALGATN